MGNGSFVQVREEFELSEFELVGFFCIAKLFGHLPS